MRSNPALQKYGVYAAIAAIVVLFLLILLIWQPWRSSTPAPVASTTPTAPATTATPTVTAAPATTGSATTAVGATTPGASATTVASAATVAPGQQTEPVFLYLPGGGNAAIGKLTFEGKAAPGVEVELLLDGKVSGKTKANAEGVWSIPTELTQTGSVKVEARPVGKPELASKPGTLTLVTPAAPLGSGPTLKALPELVAPGEMTFEGTADPNTGLELLLNGKRLSTTLSAPDGNWLLKTYVEGPLAATFEVRSIAEEGKPAPTSKAVKTRVLAPIVLNIPNDGRVKASEAGTLTGTAEPNSELELLSQGKSLGKVKVGADSKWSLNTSFAPGEYTLEGRTNTTPPVVLRPTKLTISN
jgi:large repetitive protein